MISGGGRRNKTLMAMIAGLVDAAVAPAEAAGMDGDAVEAEAWAYLAVRSLEGLPITFPGTTGVPRPLTGGVLARGVGVIPVLVTRDPPFNERWSKLMAGSRAQGPG